MVDFIAKTSENNGCSLRYQLIECAFSLRAFPIEIPEKVLQLKTQTMPND